MADFVYCGTEPPVGATGTQQLLLGPFHAIWCPPAALPTEPVEGDRIWLVWRSSPVAAPILLGGGRVAVTVEGRFLWTNATLPGVRPAAEALGYRGPTNMAFLHLIGLKSPQGHPVANVGAIETGLNAVSVEQVQMLSQLLPILEEPHDMSPAEVFMSQFDESGHYRNGNGTLDVVFLTRSGGRYPGKLHFNNGLCVRAEMKGGGDWSYPDNSPLTETRFLLDFSEDKPRLILIDRGRVIHHQEASERSTKQEFLTTFRIARNLFSHPDVTADSPEIDTRAVEQMIARAAIWLTPKSVAGFNASDFPELGLDRQRELQDAVKCFLDVANHVPADKPATSEQVGNARVAFQRILRILDPYLPVHEESRTVEKAISSLSTSFPPWVVNWDYELASDSDGTPAVWVNIFVDEKTAPLKQLGRYASELTTNVRQALTAYHVGRWPYIRMRTAREHKSQVQVNNPCPTTMT